MHHKFFLFNCGLSYFTNWIEPKACGTSLFCIFFLLGTVYFVCCEFIFHLVFMWLFSSKEELNSCILQHLGESPLPAYEPVFDWENERSMIFGQRIPEAHIAQYGRFGQLS